MIVNEFKTKQVLGVYLFLINEATEFFCGIFFKMIVE